MAESKRVVGWPLGIAIIYGLFVLVLLIYVVFSTYNTVDLVTEDYYTKELQYQEHIDRKNRTSTLKEGVIWNYSEESQIIHLRFPSTIDPVQISGKIVFFRPSDAKLDNSIIINPDINGLQTIDVTNLKPGMWRIKIFWKVNVTDYYNEGTVYIHSYRND